MLKDPKNAMLCKYNDDIVEFYGDNGTKIMAIDSGSFTFTTAHSIRIGIMPRIKKVIINDPAVIIYWTDDSKTVVKCLPNDTFNPEIGLAMAISRKYYETMGCPNPRAAFKRDIKNATDYRK